MLIMPVIVADFSDMKRRDDYLHIYTFRTATGIAHEAATRPPKLLDASLNGLKLTWIEPGSRPNRSQLVEPARGRPSLRQVSQAKPVRITPTDAC